MNTMKIKDKMAAITVALAVTGMATTTGGCVETADGLERLEDEDDRSDSSPPTATSILSSRAKEQLEQLSQLSGILGTGLSFLKFFLGLGGDDGPQYVELSQQSIDAIEKVVDLSLVDFNYEQYENDLDAFGKNLDIYEQDAPDCNDVSDPDCVDAHENWADFIRDTLLAQPSTGLNSLWSNFASEGETHRLRRVFFIPQMVLIATLSMSAHSDRLQHQMIANGKTDAPEERSAMCASARDFHARLRVVEEEFREWAGQLGHTYERQSGSNRWYCFLTPEQAEAEREKANGAPLGVFPTGAYECSQDEEYRDARAHGSTLAHIAAIRADMLGDDFYGFIDGLEEVIEDPQICPQDYEEEYAELEGWGSEAFCEAYHGKWVALAAHDGKYVHADATTDEVSRAGGVGANARFLVHCNDRHQAFLETEADEQLTPAEVQEMFMQPWKNAQAAFTPIAIGSKWAFMTEFNTLIRAYQDGGIIHSTTAGQWGTFTVEEL